MISGLKENAKKFLQGFFTRAAKDLDLASGPGPTLVIAPHPDDESLGCGATIAHLRKKGERVRVVIVTDGAASGKSAVISPQQLAATRREETKDAVKALGASPEDVVFLNFPDAHTQEHFESVMEALGKQIADLRPQRVFSPYGSDGHSDHRLIASAIERLYQKGAIPCPVYEYPIWFWSRHAFNHLFMPEQLGRLRRVPTAPYLEAKKMAIAAHRSQYQAPTGEDGWFTFPTGFLTHFLTSHEIFFEKPLR